MKRTIPLLAGVAIILIGLGFIFPAVAQLRDTGALPALSVGLLLLGIALTLGGGAALLFGAKRLRA